MPGEESRVGNDPELRTAIVRQELRARRAWLARQQLDYSRREVERDNAAEQVVRGTRCARYSRSPMNIPSLPRVCVCFRPKSAT